MGEDYLRGVNRVKPLSDFAATVFKRLRGIRPRQVLCPMHIGRAVDVVMVQRVEQRLRFLRGSGVVQIGLALPLQCGDGWKVSTPGGACSANALSTLDTASDQL